MISKRVEVTIEGWLRKREDLEVEEKQAFVEYVRGMRNVEALATSRWFVNGVVRVPEDQPKVSQAIKVAKIAKVDPLAYGSPMELINQHQTIKLKGEMINPDEVSTLHKVREFPKHGIVIYDVDEGEESRQNMREIIDTHFGVNANPWCLLQGDGEGNLTEKSLKYWNRYAAYPKQACFVNGKLNAFSANDLDDVVWWNRFDESLLLVQIEGKVPGDPLGRSGFLSVDPQSGIEYGYVSLHRGNKENGLYEEWWNSSQLRCRENYKNGVRDGFFESWRPNGQLEIQGNFKDGQREGPHERWYPNGNPHERINFKDGQREGLLEQWTKDGQLDVRETFKNGKREGLREEFHDNGQLECREIYKDDKLDGLREEWYPNGQLKSKCAYKNGRHVGPYEEWYDNGQLKERITYKWGTRNGSFETWHDNGQPKVRATCKSNEFHGPYEEWFADGTLFLKTTFNLGKEDGLFRMYHENGQLHRLSYYDNGELDGLQERWYDNGQLESRYDLVNKCIDGYSVSYSRDGELRHQCTYKNGKEDGLNEDYGYDGRILTRVFYRDGKCIAKGADALKLAEATKSQGVTNEDKKVINIPKEKGKSRGVR